MSLMWCRRTPPGTPRDNASGTSDPTGAKMIAPSSGRGGGSFENPAHVAPISRSVRHTLHASTSRAHHLARVWVYRSRPSRRGRDQTVSASWLSSDPLGQSPSPSAMKAVTLPDVPPRSHGSVPRQKRDSPAVLGLPATLTARCTAATMPPANAPGTSSRSGSTSVVITLPTLLTAKNMKFAVNQSR
jgi:hypothetical protein